MLLWVVFLTAGLVPEPVYHWLRESGGVLPHRALINSPYLVTLMLAAYVILFVLHRCIEAGLSPYLAQDRALQLGVVALVAFLPLDLVVLFTAHLHPLIQSRFLLYLAGVAKLAAWWYLFTLLLRYYVFRADDVFARIPSLFPSTHHHGAARKTSESASNEPEADQASDGPHSRSGVSERD